jgi:hypothetical protein
MPLKPQVQRVRRSPFITDASRIKILERQKHGFVRSLHRFLQHLTMFDPTRRDPAG